MGSHTNWELPPRTRDDFEVAIMCALPKEAEAVLAVWDGSYQDYGKEYGKADGDQNKYTTGRIGKHAVVVLWLDSMGKVSSAVAAAQLQMSYRKIRLAILVGICGGCPQNNKGQEILLGDVVISSEIHEYDFKKRYPNGDVVIDTCKYRKHDPLISAIIERLAARDGVQFTKDIARHLQDLETKSRALYKHPGYDKDILFQPEYLHKHRQQKCAVCNEGETTACGEARGKACEELGCNPNQQVRRARLDGIYELAKAGTGGISLNPQVHFGIMGCGDMVIKSGQHRDEIIKQQSGIIALEMESAGMFGCLAGIVIKSVCDYADSHKNKKWQDYAAGTAACAAKALLESFTPTDRNTVDRNDQAIAGPLPVGLPASCYERSPPPLKHRICVNFIDRTEVLREMANVIFHEMPIGQQKRFLVCGMAGSGKTQLCRWFASVYKQKFWGVFMVDASSLAAANTDFGTIAHWAGLKTTGGNGKRFLATSPDGWLLIVDNADREIDDDELFPQTDRGCILITSRNTSLRYSQINLNMNPMGTEDGITLFLREAKKDTEDPSNRALARPLVRKLGCLPLAIKHAAVPVTNKLKTLGDVLEYYNENMERLLNDSKDKGDDTYQYRTLYTSIGMSLQTMASYKDVKDLSRALEILQLCAFLHFTDIPEEVINAAPSWANQSLIHYIRASVSRVFWPNFHPDRPSIVTYKEKDHTIDRASVTRGLSYISSFSPTSKEKQDLSDGDKNRRALSLLDSIGLGCLDAESRSFSMHPVIHEWNRSRLSSQDCQHARKSVGVALSHVISWRERGDSSSRQGGLRRGLLSHVDFYLKSGDINTPCIHALSIDQAEVAEKFALVYEDNGNYHAARVLLQESVDAKTTILGRKNAKTLNSLHRLSIVLQRQRDYKNSAEFSKEAWEGFQELLGEESEESLESLGSYASSLNGLGQFLEAERINRSCLEIRQHLAIDTADTVEIKSNLAIAVLQQGKFDEAINLLTQANEWHKKNFSHHNTETMRSLHNLALAYRKAGEIKLAAEKGHEVLELRKHVLGDDHPDTLASKRELALAELKLGNREIAKKLSLDASIGLNRCMGTSSLSTIDSLSSLAAVKRNLGDYKFAEYLYRRVLDGYQQHFPRNHVDILTTMTNLAGVVFYCKRYDEAVKIYRQTLDGFKTQHEPDHPDVIRCQISLALALAELNDDDGPNEANEIHREVESRIESSYPGHHYVKSHWLFNYGVFLRDRGDLSKAKQKILEAMDGYEAKLGVQSEGFMNSLACYAYILDLEQKYEEAWREYVKALDGYKELGGPMTFHHKACARRFADMKVKMETLNDIET